MSKVAPKTYLASGHRGCAGCCDALAAKFMLMGAG
ncbi:MAG: pyruvate ferredoxin oxidoreductase, partial [Methanosarcinaceae archaeon]|nr:pyruvate ferredoxin oxidoreductase [Methanosarcinaceae archaeon]